VAYVFGQNPTAVEGTGTSISKAFASNTTAHSLLVALLTVDTGVTIGTLAFSGGGTWVVAGSVLNTADTQWVVIGYCLDATGGATTVQANWTGSSSFNGLFIAEFTNGGVASLFDTSTAGRLQTGTTITDVAVSASDNAVVISHINISGVAVTSAGGGFTLWTNNETTFFDWGEYQVLTGAGSVTPTFNLASSGASGIISAAFKPAAAAAGPVIFPARPGKTWRRRFKHRQVLPAVPAAAAIDLGPPEIVMRPRIPC
jgi:hypothetical protein